MERIAVKHYYPPFRFSMPCVFATRQPNGNFLACCAIVDLVVNRVEPTSRSLLSYPILCAEHRLECRAPTVGPN